MTKPKVSVILCTANRATDLAVSLRRMAQLQVPARREVQFVVVDNGSRDDTPRVLKQACATLPIKLELAQEPRPGLAMARNRGLQHATGDIIAWTDDDCIASEDWLVRLIAHFEADSLLDVLGGRVELHDPSHAPITVKTSREFEVMHDLTFAGAIVLGCNMAFRRRVVERIGTFDPRFGAGTILRAGEDADFIHRAFRAGCRVVYAPDVVVYHNHKRITRQQVLRLRRSYNMSDGAYLTKHAIAGDRIAAKWLYWRLRHLLADLLARPISLQLTLDRLSFIAAYLQGVLLFLVQAHGPAAGRPDR